MSFTDLDQIRREFKIEEQKPEDIRSRLRAIQGQLHPDRTGGKFQEDEDKERFLRISEALEYLEKHEMNENALVPMNVMTDLVKIMRDLVPAHQEKSAEAVLNSCIASKLATLHTKFRTPRITTSAISISLTAIWLFPKQIADHPVLGHYLDPSRQIFNNMWMSTVVLTSIIWVLTSMQEEKRKRFLGVIKTEGWQNIRFMHFLEDIKFDEANKRRFTKDSFVRDLMLQQRHVGSGIFEIVFQRTYELDPELAQGIADSVINRAEQRGLIAKESLKTLSETYYVC